MNRLALLWFRLHHWFGKSRIGKGLGRIPGVKTFDGLMYDQLTRLIGRLGNIPIHIQGSKMYVDTLDRDIGAKLLANGFREEAYQTELFRAMVKGGMVVVDIGANIGYYTLIAAQLVGQEGTVYAFEPEPSNHRLLCRNIEVNGYSNVVTIQKAVSNTYGKANLWFEKGWSGSPSLSRDTVLAVSQHGVLEEGGAIEVETINLDGFFENMTGKNKVDIIKIDTGGAEGFVIDGAPKILSTNNLAVFMEFTILGLESLGIDPWSLLRRLQEYGFEIWLIDERKKALEPLESIESSEFRQKAIAGVNLLLQK